jgi:hypothetical protein
MIKFFNYHRENFTKVHEPKEFVGFVLSVVIGLMAVLAIVSEPETEHLKKIGELVLAVIAGLIAFTWMPYKRHENLKGQHDKEKAELTAKHGEQVQQLQKQIDTLTDEQTKKLNVTARLSVSNRTGRTECSINISIVNAGRMPVYFKEAIIDAAVPMPIPVPGHDDVAQKPEWIIGYYQAKEIGPHGARQDEYVAVPDNTSFVKLVKDGHPYGTGNVYLTTGEKFYFEFDLSLYDDFSRGAFAGLH